MVSLPGQIQGALNAQMYFSEAVQDVDWNVALDLPLLQPAAADILDTLFTVFNKSGDLQGVEVKS
jgi:hypothetical protein